MLARLKDPAVRARIKREMDDPNAPCENQWYGSGGGDGVMLSSVLDPSLRKYEGMTFDRDRQGDGEGPSRRAIDLVIADKAESSVIISIMREDDVVTAMRTRGCRSTPIRAPAPKDGPLSESKSHPRAWGTFTAGARQVRPRRQGAHPEEAVRKTTSQAAVRVGLHDRGVLRPGIGGRHHGLRPGDGEGRRDLRQTDHYSIGMSHVFVNGKAVVADGAITQARPGRALRGPGSR